MTVDSGFVAATSISSASSGTIPIAIPAAVEVGDLMVVVAQSNNGAVGTVTTAGWTRAPAAPSESQANAYTKIATASDLGTSVYVTLSVYAAGGYGTGWATLFAYRTAAQNPIDAIASESVSNPSTPSVTTTVPNDLVVSVWWGCVGDDTQGGANDVQPVPPASVTTRYAGGFCAIADTVQAVPGATPTQRETSAGSWGESTLTIAIVQQQAPNAPTGLTPTNTTVDRTVTQRFAWTYSNPIATDTQSAFDFQWRHKGSADTWNLVNGSTPNTFYDAPANTFPAEDIEYQVRNYDQGGLAGPWSALTYFTAANPTGTPTITAPVSGGTIGLTPDTVTWSTPAQQGYQVRRVADNNGQPDTGTIYYDTGQVADPNTRSLSVAFETNNRAEHIQVRVQQNTLWSSWADELVHVSYTPPATPTLTLQADSPTGTITVRPTQPTPANGQPAVVSIDIWCRTATPLASSTFDNGGAFDTGPTYDKGGTVTGAIVDPQRPQGSGIRLAATLPPNTPWVDRGPASGVEYEYQIVANGSNTTTATSAWIG